MTKWSKGLFFSLRVNPAGATSWQQPLIDGPSARWGSKGTNNWDEKSHHTEVHPFVKRVPKKWRMKSTLYPRRRTEGTSPAMDFTSLMIIFRDLSWSNYCKAWKKKSLILGWNSFRESNYPSPIRSQQTGALTRKAAMAGWGRQGDELAAVGFMASA